MVRFGPRFVTRKRTGWIEIMQMKQQRALPATNGACVRAFVCCTRTHAYTRECQIKTDAREFVKKLPIINCGLQSARKGDGGKGAKESNLFLNSIPFTTGSFASLDTHYPWWSSMKSSRQLGMQWFSARFWGGFDSHFCLLFLCKLGFIFTQYNYIITRPKATNTNYLLSELFLIILLLFFMTTLATCLSAAKRPFNIHS